MAVRIPDLGGDEWEAGTALLAADLNDTVQALVVHRLNYTDTTERTTTSQAWVDSPSSATITSGLNKLITGITLKCNIKSDSDTASYNIQLKGDNLGGSTFITAADSGGVAAAGVSVRTTEAALFSTTSGTYSTSGNTINPAIKLLDDTTKVIIRFNNSTGNSAFLDEVDLRITYVDDFADD